MPNSPKKNEEKLDKMVMAWETLAPAVKFANIGLDEFKVFVADCKQARVEIAQIEDQRTQKLNLRDDKDKVALGKAELVVNGVVGDVAFGPNSALYEAMGYIRKSERKSGLTRKKKGQEK